MEILTSQIKHCNQDKLVVEIRPRGTKSELLSISPPQPCTALSGERCWDLQHELLILQCSLWALEKGTQPPKPSHLGPSEPSTVLVPPCRPTLLPWPLWDTPDAEGVRMS